MGDVFDQRRQAPEGSRVRAMRVSTPSGPIFVPIEDELHAPQGVTEETRRTIRRKILDPCGREGLEFVEEHHIVYAPPQPTAVRREDDAVRHALAAFASFIIVAVTFTAAGGGDQSFAWAPVYWIAFFLLWAWLA